MNQKIEAEALTALGHQGRLAVFRLLVRRAPGGVRPSEIAKALGLKPNTLSAYLTTLARAGLITSERDGKSVYYSIDLNRAGMLVRFLVDDCCRSRPELYQPLAGWSLGHPGEAKPATTLRIYNVLFVSTGNAARSIFAEAILNKEGAGKFKAYSAGTRPDPDLSPLARAVLQKLGHDTATLHTKKIAEFNRPDAPQMDFVLTVCDRAANEECPPWPGRPLTAHWGIPDPGDVEGTDVERSTAFINTYRTLQRGLEGFRALQAETPDRMLLQNQLDQIGRQLSLTAT